MTITPPGFAPAAPDLAVPHPNETRLCITGASRNRALPCQHQTELCLTVTMPRSAALCPNSTEQRSASTVRYIAIPPQCLTVRRFGATTPGATMPVLDHSALHRNYTMLRPARPSLHIPDSAPPQRCDALHHRCTAKQYFTPPKHHRAGQDHALPPQNQTQPRNTHALPNMTEP